jgi:PRTRC genetic system ThiF family protein
MTPYTLDNQFMQYGCNVTVVGCGGTGGFVAEGLCRMLPQRSVLLLIDSDRVEERNLLRQNFYTTELGKFKSEALSQRLAAKFNRAVAYSTLPVAMVKGTHNIIIGCVDNGPARADIADIASHRRYLAQSQLSGWWVDAGNGENYGQVLIGNASTEQLCPSFGAIKRGAICTDICVALPLPTIQRPELLKQAVRTNSCAAAVARDDQSPIINQAMAALTLEVVRRIINGACSWMGLYLDMENGSLNPVYATPQNVSRLTGIPERKLLHRGETAKGGEL